MSANVKSVRKLASNEIRAISKKWMELDQKSDVKNNFSNVQCLNCHSVQDDHPFNSNMQQTPEKNSAHVKSKCLSCHTADQSPEWYGKDLKTVNEKYFAQKFKKLSCPKVQ